MGGMTMAKETDYAIVQQHIEQHLQATEWQIEEVFGHDLLVLAVLNIYMTNDLCRGFGQDFLDGKSIISSRRIISVIIGRHSSLFKDNNYICLYEDLDGDINEILMIMQAAYDRIQFT